MSFDPRRQAVQEGKLQYLRHRSGNGEGRRKAAHNKPLHELLQLELSTKERTREELALLRESDDCTWQARKVRQSMEAGEDDDWSGFSEEPVSQYADECFS